MMRDCSGKTQFASAEVARSTAAKMRKRHQGTALKAYKCNCGFWHVGSDVMRRSEPMTPDEEYEWNFLQKRNTWL